MNPRLLPATLLLGLTLLSGCATFNDTELGIIRGSGVSPRIYGKIESGRVLTPEDVIELTRRHVPERYIVRQIEDVGVDYVLNPRDRKRLESARVSPAVVDALEAASSDFSGRYANPAPHHRVYYTDPYYYDYDPYYYGPYAPRPYWYGGSVDIGISSGHRHWHR